jgi:hypothetical protein
MTDEIARLRELLAGATARPWRWSHLLDGIEARAILDGSGYFFASSDDPQNGELIAAAVNALPALLDRLEAAEREIGFYRAMADGAMEPVRRLATEALQAEKEARRAAERRVGELKVALVECAIPLETLVAVEGDERSALAEETRDGILRAVLKIRAALRGEEA